MHNIITLLSSPHISQLENIDSDEICLTSKNALFNPLNIDNPFCKSKALFHIAWQQHYLLITEIKKSRRRARLRQNVRTHDYGSYVRLRARIFTKFFLVLTHYLMSLSLNFRKDPFIR